MPTTVQHAEKPHAPLLLGVDAGGTKTCAVVATPRGDRRFCILGSGAAGPGNPLSGGFSAASRAISLAVDAALQDADCSGEEISAAVYAVAGAARPDVREQLEAMADDLPTRRTATFVPDYEPVLAAAAVSGPAVGVIAGTGSVAFSRDREGRLRFFGGWGHLLGDDGSGFAIGRDALRQIIDDEELGKPVSTLGRRRVPETWCFEPSRSRPAGI